MWKWFIYMFTTYQGFISIISVLGYQRKRNVSEVHTWDEIWVKKILEKSLNEYHRIF